MSHETIQSLAPRVAAGTLRAERLAEDALAQATRLQSSLNAFITLTADTALASARAADKEIAGGRYRGLLHGIPVALKDVIDVAGVPTTAASRLREGVRATTDAPIVAHLRDAGAVLVGKNNLHEFAFGTTNEDSGWGPARHALDSTRSPGGSSGGSAVAVSTGMATVAVGTDTGGSVRIPAAACGLVGLKPAWGDVCSDGVVPLSRQLDHVGPLAHSVHDAAVLYHVLRGERLQPPDTIALSGIRLARLDGFFLDRLSSEVEDSIVRAYDKLGAAGTTLSSSELPHAADIAPIYLHLVLADAAAYHATTLYHRPHAYTANVRLRLEMGGYVLAEDYARALRGRELITNEVTAALQGVDALVLPTLGIEAPPLGAVRVAVKGGSEAVRTIMLRCTQPFNLSRHPAISIPCGVTSTGLPVGLQLVGHAGRTDGLLQVAQAVAVALEPLTAALGSARTAASTLVSGPLA